ncbi:hypothetical protein [Salipiger aestuarii]|uniref:Uncharacterized protein DUF1127 n=1 Tax=Salipiger aestuarii TaxID=568098 RepID=A0A327Y409_9RHOB|nr:hypothetical protein [Salipiger aestuarii]RAK15177.1 uncharacterized protein DUF1127 [Salipiger aestuarii]
MSDRVTRLKPLPRETPKMALIDHMFHEPLSRRVARLFETPFARRQRALAARVAALRAMSDRELSERGLSRDTILPHVFGGR